MIYLGMFFLVIAIFGIYWTILGAATVGVVYSIVSLNFLRRKKTINNDKRISFEVLIAAYNEQVNLPYTLESLSQLNLDNNNLDFKVYVGLDHCTDGTLDIVKKYLGLNRFPLQYFENEGERGKWFIIKQLILKSNADWVALTDCGAVWNQNILKECFEKFRDEDLICLAPSYLPDQAGFLETSYWRMEQFLRILENGSRGSIMVHGPTVFYRRSALLLAIDLLGNKHWINDDVAIPLVLRNYNDKFRIEYYASLEHKAWVRDRGVVSDVNIELKRRRRILIGNIQCALEIIIPKFHPFNLISLTSSRLVSKLLWAYWLTFFILGMLFTSIAYIKEIGFFFADHLEMLASLITVVLFGIIMSIKSNYVHRLFMAYISGLQIHKAAKALENPKKIVWS